MISATEKEYRRRLNLALRYIDLNLGGPLSLDRMAEAAFFSPFHFHRIFSAFMGEPPAEYVRRLRLEKAAVMLATNPGRPVSDIALDCGFSSSALFSRSFKERFGAPPRVWRAGRDAAGMALTSKNDQVLRKERKDAAEAFGYPEGVEHPEWREQMEQELKDTVVEVKRLAGWKMAYVLQGKGYDQKGICAAYGKLFAWAGPRGLLTEKTRAIGMGVDNPDITPKDKCRYYAGIPVPEGTAAEGEVGIMDIAAGNYAVARFEGTPDIIKKAYGYMYGVWLPAHGYQPGDAPAFEVYYSTPDKDPRGFFSFELSVPVKPL